MQDSPTTLEKLAVYNNWANERVLQTLEKQGSDLPANSLHLFSHIMNAQAIWLSRMENIPYPGLPFDEHTLEECREMHLATSEHLQEMASLPSESLEEVIHYTNSKGETFENTVHDILTHVFNHSTYHRAQIAKDLRQNNLEPIATDYINMVRKPV